MFVVTSSSVSSLLATSATAICLSNSMYTGVDAELMFRDIYLQTRKTGLTWKHYTDTSDINVGVGVQ